MANAIKDDNKIPTMLGLDSTDGVTPAIIKVTPTDHAILISNGTTGSDLGSNPAKRDNNGEPVLMAVSSADGTTPVALYVDTSNGALLTKST